MLLALALFFTPALGSSTFVYRDTGRLHEPMKRWIADELRHGRLPQWNPFSGLGAPVLANAIDAVQHPFSGLLVLWPEQGLKIWILLSFLAAGWGTLAWVRTLGLSPAAAAGAGIAFALSGPLVSSSDNVTYLTAYATLPWAFAALQRWLSRGGPGPLAAVSATGALCAAAGDPQALGILLVLITPYALAFSPAGQRRRAVRRAAIAMATTVIASAPFLLPVALWLPHASRTSGIAGEELRRWNLHPLRLAEFFLPDLLRGPGADPISPLFQACCSDGVAPMPWFLSVYLGAAVIALAAVGAAADPRARWTILAGLALAWAALGHHAGFGQLAERVPILSSFRYWEKLAVWPALAMAVAAAAGVDAILGRGSKAVPIGIGGAALAVLAFALLAPLVPAGASVGASAWPSTIQSMLEENLRRGARHAGIVLAALALLAALAARPTVRRILPLAIVALVAADLFGGNGGAYVMGPPGEVSPPPLVRSLPSGARVLTPFPVREDRWPERGRIASAWEWCRRTLAPSWNVPLRVTTPQDYLGLRDARWERLGSVVGGESWAAMGFFGYDHLLVVTDLRLAGRVGVAPAAPVVATDLELPAWIVAVPHRPRAYLADGVRSVTAEDAFRFAAHGGARYLTVVEGPAAPVVAGGTARIVLDVPGTTLVETSAAGPALLVLNDAWAPGWSGEVDGRHAEIVRANWLVRGVWLPAGTHRVRFHYRTPGLVPGWALAGAEAAFLAAWALGRRRRTGAVASRATPPPTPGPGRRA